MKYLQYAVTLFVVYLLHAGLIWVLFRWRLSPEPIASLNLTFSQAFWFVVIVNIAVTDIRLEDFDDQQKEANRDQRRKPT